MKTHSDLNKQLMSIDHRGYPAYKDLQGSYSFPEYTLSIDHVQGDPFAAPSKLRITVDKARAMFPPSLYDRPHKRIALQDYINRVFYSSVERFLFKAKGSGKSGLINVSRCGQEVLERTACRIDDGSVEVRFEVGFPANGRTINARELEKILFDFLPQCARQSLFYPRLNHAEIGKAIDLSEDQQAIRDELKRQKLAAFVANGSILPRESGVSDLPLKNAVPFASPKEMEITLNLPHRGKITGMGIKQGITLIVGGGYHGKSTLLQALELGVYNHKGGDGREYIIADDTAVKLRAEDGRSIKGVDISLFINHLPNQKDTTRFYSEDASGSTSQAANVVEGIEAGTSLFLIDEDTSATNFMLRDQLMQRVIAREKEPITPFIEMARPIYEALGISTVLVAGSSGAYFHIADTILQMDCYVPKDITQEVKLLLCGSEYENQAPVSAAAFHTPSFHRIPRPNQGIKRSDRVKLKVLGRDAFSINHDTVDLRFVEQLADPEQVAALCCIVKMAEESLVDGKKDLSAIVDAIQDKIARQGLFSVSESKWIPMAMAMPRRQEIFACLNRYRGLNL